MNFRIAHISDPHLSRERPFFQHNWEVMVETLNENPPDLIVCTGDISMNGAETESELAYAAGQLRRLSSELLIVPGNHDCGNSFPDVRGNETLITAERVEAFRRHVGPDFWFRDIGKWRLVGLNSMLPGSGLPAEAEQWQWLEETLATSDGRSIIVYMHKPLFLNDAAEVQPTQSSLYPEHRQRLVRLLQDHKVAVLASGHIHDYRRQRLGSLKLIWAPSTAFVIDGFGLVRPRYGTRRVGYLECNLNGRRLASRFVEPHRLINIDLGNWVRNPEGFHALYAAEPTRGVRLEAATPHRLVPLPREFDALKRA